MRWALRILKHRAAVPAEGTGDVNEESIEVRLVRVEALSRGLAKEIALVNEDQGALLWLEKRADHDHIELFIRCGERDVAVSDLGETLHRLSLLGVHVSEGSAQL